MAGGAHSVNEDPAERSVRVNMLVSSDDCVLQTNPVFMMATIFSSTREEVLHYFVILLHLLTSSVRQMCGQLDVDVQRCRMYSVDLGIGSVLVGCIPARSGYLTTARELHGQRMIP